jgi:hypothetical protein
MNRNFFDVVGHERSELDYTGRMLPTAEEAYDAAEMMAFDLAVKRAEEMVGFEVAVSNADGHRVFSIPVKESYLTAMPAEWGVSPMTVNRARVPAVADDAFAKPCVSLDVKTRKMAA